MKNKNITFTDAAGKSEIRKIYAVFNRATIELGEPVGGSFDHAFLFVVCFSCDRTKVDSKAELRRCGWYLADRFELCPDHAGERENAWARFDQEVTTAFGS